MLARLAEQAAHREDALPGFRGAEDVEPKLQCAEEAFIAKQAARFEQEHGRDGFLGEREARPGQQFPPFADGQRSRADMNVARHLATDVFLDRCRQVIGRETQFVDAVASTGLQQAEGFSDDAALLFRACIVNIASP